jgi:predicted DNA-binding transcriptional regulator AlpA
MALDKGIEYTALLGMKEISNHMRMSESTVLKLIREEGFPAKKVGGQWISDITAIKKWRIAVLEDITINAKKNKESELINKIL